jgi:hypothetical protein
LWLALKVADEASNALGDLDEAGGIEIACLAQVADGSAENGYVERVDELAGLAGVPAG